MLFVCCLLGQKILNYWASTLITVIMWPRLYPLELQLAVKCFRIFQHSWNICNNPHVMGKIIHCLGEFLGGDKTYHLCHNLMKIVQEYFGNLSPIS